MGVSLSVLGRPYEARARVANCRPEPSQPGWHRLGLLVLETERLSAAVWNRMLEERAGG